MKLNLSLFHKLVFANILYSLPVIGLVYLMTDAKNLNINFAVSELKGNVYQRPLEKIMKELGDARSSAYSSDGKTQIAKVSELFQDLKMVQKNVGEDLQFTQEGLKKRNRETVLLENLTDRWQKFSASFDKLSPSQRQEDLAKFIADFRTMITHAGDTSNLILDPDLDSYYLMDVTLLALPQTQDRVQDILTYVETITAKGQFGETEKRTLSVYAALLKQSDMDRITADTQTIIQEDPNFYGVSPGLKANLEPAIKVYAEKTSAFIDAIQKLSDAENLQQTSTVIKTGHEALSESYAAWFVAVDELDYLLNNRVQILVQDRNVSLAISLVALAIAFGILFGVARSFNQFMKVILSKLQTAVAQSSQSSKEIVHVSEALSQSAEQQSSALHETASALEEIKSMVDSTLSSSDSAEKDANESFISTNSGHENMKQLFTAISEIATSNDQISKTVESNATKMNATTKIIAEIESKTKVINDIVFQTKLLSFNASVEAARAGEHGKGFAVVAEEVGKLAQMSGTASKEISGMLENSVTQVEKINQVTKNEVMTLVSSGKEVVNSGRVLAERCVAALDDILARVQQLKQSVSSIHSAASEQAKGIQEISKAMHGLEHLTKQNSEVSKETSEHSQALTVQAQNLLEIVEIIQMAVLGQTQKSADTQYDSSEGREEPRAA